VIYIKDGGNGFQITQQKPSQMHASREIYQCTAYTATTITTKKLYSAISLTKHESECSDSGELS